MEAIRVLGCCNGRPGCFRIAFAFVLVLGAAHTRGAELKYPLSIAVHESGKLYLADRDLPGVWELDGGKLKLFFQGSKTFKTPLNAIRCVALDREGRVLAGDSATRTVYRFDESGKPKPLTDGMGAGMIGIPMDIVLDRDGNLLVSDLDLRRIVKVPKDGGPLTVIANEIAARGLFYDSQARLWVITAHQQLLRLSADGKQETVVEKGVFQFPHTVVVRHDGVAFVCDGYAKAIWRVSPGQQPEKWLSGEPLVSPVGLDIQGDKLFVADPHAKAVFEVDAQGKIIRRELQVVN